MTLPEVLSAEQLAELLGCQGETVQQLAIAGELPGVKVGRGWVFPTEALLVRLNQMATEQSAERKSARAGAQQAAGAPVAGAPARGRRRTPSFVLPDL